jgi:hypothetical protein
MHECGKHVLQLIEKEIQRHREKKKKTKKQTHQMLSGVLLACSTRPKFTQELQETRRVSQHAPAMKGIIYFKQAHI